MAIQFEFTEVEVEGDALTIIKKCNSTTQDRSAISTYIQDLKEIKRFFFQEIRFMHTRRAKNMVAHTIATDYLKKRVERYMIREIPESVESLVRDQWIREPD